MAYTKGQFQELFNEFLKHEMELLNVKRGEYTEDGEADSLQNFRQVAAFEGRSPEEVCFTYIMKHMQSLQRAVSTGEYINAWWSEEQGVEGIKQRIADIRNYLLLLAAIMDDKSVVNATSEGAYRE